MTKTKTKFCDSRRQQERQLSGDDSSGKQDKSKTLTLHSRCCSLLTFTEDKTSVLHPKKFE